MSYEKARDASAEAQRIMEEFNMKIKKFDQNIAKSLKEIERDFLEPEYTFWQRIGVWLTKPFDWSGGRKK